MSKQPAWGSMSNRKWDTSTWVAEPARIADELGWRAVDSFEDGFRRTVDWTRRRSPAAAVPAPGR